MQNRERAPGRQGERTDRQHWMSVLARATRTELTAAWDALTERPAYEFLRRPEIGLVMARGRAGGTGQPFNFGELTVTRCAVRLADGTVGHSYAAGRDARKAELAAVIDALLQQPDSQAGLGTQIIAPLERRQSEARALTSRKAAATKVEFFTLVRGDNPK